MFDGNSGTAASERACKDQWDIDGTAGVSEFEVSAGESAGWGFLGRNWGSPQRQWYPVGLGYCRGPAGSSQRVNGRARMLPSEAECAAACTEHASCNGYAFDYTDDVDRFEWYAAKKLPAADRWARLGELPGTCFIYGAGLDAGLTAFEEPLGTAEWEGDSQPNAEIGSAALGWDDRICMKRNGATPPAGHSWHNPHVQSLD